MSNFRELALKRKAEEDLQLEKDLMIAGEGRVCLL